MAERALGTHPAPDDQCAASPNTRPTRKGCAKPGTMVGGCGGWDLIGFLESIFSRGGKTLTEVDGDTVTERAGSDLTVPDMMTVTVVGCRMVS